MKVGEEQWQLQECYNCHKLRGEGGKKRGPELDNIGTLLTIEEIQQKIADPKSFMAEGYDKEWQKGIMPDKFKDLMDPKEMLALATWLLVAIVWRISSLSALVAAVLAPIYTVALIGFEINSLAVLIMSLILIWRHQSNIANLLAGALVIGGDQVLALGSCSWMRGWRSR